MLGSLVEDELSSRKKKKMATNIDGATAVVYLEIGFAPALGRALFVLSRSVGVVANAWEEMQAGSRLKGPMPARFLPRYVGSIGRSIL
jgi:citrate synthase